VERLIAGQSIESVIDKNIVFPNLGKDETCLYSLFFFSGYLKCLSRRMEEDELVCELKCQTERCAISLEKLSLSG